MSGEAFGLILLPLALAALPVVAGGLVVTGAVALAARAGSAAVKYESERRKQREAIRLSEVSGTIGNFRSEIQQNMNELTRLNIETSEKMMAELNVQRNNMVKIAQQHDIEAYNNYVSQLKPSHAETMQTIERKQQEFNIQYKQKITESMSSVSETINAKYNEYISELESFKSDLALKEKKAQEIARSYIEEARTLLQSLADDFEGRKFSLRQMESLNNEFNLMVSSYNKGNYESAIAMAKDVVINTLEEIYDADAKKQEWENYYKLALVLSDEILEYIKSQGHITKEAKEYAEKATGKELEADIVGISVADYTDKNSNGENKYNFLMKKTKEIHSALRSSGAQNLTVKQLKDYCDFLNNELYPSIASCVSKGIINMNNAFSRQNISEELIDFFEDHNFMFNGYAYEQDSHDNTLHIGLENYATGEELIISLAPELMNNGDIQTRVDLKQIKGDEANEERKAYYRQCVEEVVKGKNPYAKVSLKCNNATKNKLSSNTSIKGKLKQ